VSFDPQEEDPARSEPEQVAHSTGLALEARRESPLARLAGFARGSWRELQRVQWPDRRQVMQATGVVLGFVLVAGVFLGVADLVASNIVQKIILK